MVDGIINYSKNNFRIKELRKRFIIFSILALAIIAIVAFISIGYHQNTIKQQKSIRVVHKILLRQSSLINQISILGKVFDDDMSTSESKLRRKELESKVLKLKSSMEDLSRWIFKSDFGSLHDFEDKLKEKKIYTKISNYVSHVNILLKKDSSQQDIKNSIEYLSNNTKEGDTQYLDEVIKLIDREYLENLQSLETMGITTITMSMLVVFLVWYFLFRPLSATVLEQNRQLLDAALEIEGAARSRTDFLANISHEIRTPMTAILGYAEILKIKKEANSNKEELDVSIDEATTIINQNASHLLSLLDEVLDVSKMESGQFDLFSEKVNLPNLINEVYSLIKIKAQEKGIELVLENFGKVPEFILTDEKRLKQILFNIVGNAIKFTEKGSVKLVVSFSDLEKNRLTFLVTDTGTGIPVEKIEKIFAPFEQVYTSANREYSGTGLGLVLSRNLARKMGGDVTIAKTEVGVGTTFRIEIEPGDISEHTFNENLRTFIPPDDPLDLTEAKTLNRKNILVVDDAKENSRLFMIYLKNAGANVNTVDNGLSVLELVKDNSYDLILLDLQMPGMDGYEVFEELKKMGYSKPVCALTAHVMAEEVEKTRKAGFYGHLTKPISAEKLVSEVLAIIER